MEICNGSTYDGTFSKGLPNGVGVMRFPDSSRYEGEFMQVDYKNSGLKEGVWGVDVGNEVH